MILTDDEEAAKWFRKGRFEGRGEVMYHEDNIQINGNTINTTTDGKEPIEVFETSPSQLGVSNTGGNTLQVQ